MTSMLPRLIALNQSAFVKGRSVVDNTLLAQEIVKGYGRKIISPRYSIDFNGSLIGYFKGAKGIRQGDPLSPILFVLSVMGVITVLDNFYELSGLKLNAGKCEIFITGLSFQSLDTIIISSGFKHGRLPIRYLGVPLVSKKLSDKDCQALLDNIKNRLHQQLVLPQSIIKKIEQLCSRIFWKGSDSHAAGARVNWVKICKPKSEGGLGLKDIKSWNSACLIQHIRKLLAGKVQCG
ncbi:uncharacterized protein LOC120191605 [Hibiscus syriacus]|uniref:uncharacterized protein LOC120191605 n=1 Tax=Hibiscus syriacus TaxID=106335 RepID=UPI0019233B9C|nr:uncharacterized protein LOC120191605 [Hibiscus syriacus]